MADDTRLSELSSKLSVGAAEIDFARKALEEFGNFSEPYADDGEMEELKQIARTLLQGPCGNRPLRR